MNIQIQDKNVLNVMARFKERSEEIGRAHV